MVEGVEHMQVLYGQQLDNRDIRYVTANDKSLDMAEVVSLRVGLLVQSFEDILPENDKSAYQVLNTIVGSSGTATVHNADRNLRRVFRTTVALRNPQRRG